MKKTISPRLLILVLAIIKLVLPFLLQSGYYEPHRDEFLYLAEGQHMAWGFMEVPPLLSVFAWLVHVCGDGLFWIKFWPSLFGALTFIVVARTVFLLGGKTFAILLGFLPFVTGVYLRTHFLFQPNFLEIFFWTLLAWSMINFVQTGHYKWLYVFGISAGLGMMSKYSVSFFILSILLGLLLTPERKVFRNRHFYGAALLAFLIFLPNLLWQYQQHFPVVFHMKELRRTQLQYVNPAGFLIDQLLMNIPTVFIWITGLCALLFLQQNKQYRFTGFAYIIVIALLIAGQGKNYYALGAYPVLFAFGACQLEQFTALRFRPLRYLFILVPAIMGYVFIPLALPIFEPARLAAYYAAHHTERTGALQWEDRKIHPLPQDFADMLGWKEMAQKMAAAYNRLDSNEKKHTILFCDNYGQGGAINYYAPRFGLPQAYSDNASFLYWIPEKIDFDNIVLLTDDAQEMEHGFIKNFKSAVLTDSITSNYAVEKGDLVIILKGADETFKKFFLDKITKDRAKARW